MGHARPPARPRMPGRPWPAADQCPPAGQVSRAPLPGSRHLGQAGDHHEQLVAADQRDRQPCRHSGTDQAVTQAMGHSGRERCRDAQTQQPPRQGRHRHLAARRVEQHHRAGAGPPYRQRNQPGCPARLAVRPHKSIGMFVRRDRSDTDHDPRGGPPDDPIGCCHLAPPSTKAVVSAISLACPIGRPCSSDAWGFNSLGTHLSRP